MLFYFLFLLVISISCRRYRNSNQQYIKNGTQGYNFAIIIIIFISAFRFNIGYDWDNYCNFVYPYYSYHALPKHEPFNMLIYSIAGHFGNPLILFSIYAIITYSLIGKAISEYSCSKYDSLMIYICIFYLPGLSTIRQEIAVALIFYGYKYIEKRKIVKYIIICIIATCFHKSAIIAIAFYPLYRIKLQNCIVIIIVTFISFKTLLPFILQNFYPNYLVYLSSYSKSSGNFQRFFYITLLFYALTMYKKDKETIGLLNICATGCLFPFILGGHTGGRLAEYFLIYYCLLLPECNNKLKKSQRGLFLIPLYLYFFVYLYVSVHINHSEQYIPFKWYFFESLDSIFQ